MSKLLITIIIVVTIGVFALSWAVANELTNALQPQSVGHYWKTLKESAK